jgi:hypothetical protein
MDSPVAVKSPTNNSSDFEAGLDVANSHNDVLPDVVQREIGKHLLDVEHQLASLKADNSLNSTITDIQRSGLALRITSYRSAIAPHRKLSTDVLLEIFFQCMPIGGITARPHLSGPHAEPHNMIRVCSKWRKLVLHTSGFWRNFSVHYETAEDLQRNAILVKNMILLCGSLSLSLHMRVSDSIDLTFTETRNPISDLVTEVAGRLRDFTWVGRADILEPFLKLPAGSIEFLENIRLVVNDDHTTNHKLFGNTSSIQVFRDAYRLRAFALKATLPQQRPWPTTVISPFSLDIPWIQMTYLQFSNYIISLDSFLLLLYQCPNLSEFHGIIHQVIPTNDSELSKLPSPPPVLPNLKKLWICPFGYFYQLFIHLNLPNLTSFQLDLTHPLASRFKWDAIQITPFLAHSNCLTILRIDTPHSVPGNMIHDFLGELPLLVSFSLAKGKPLLEQTLEEIAGGTLVPKLEILESKIIAFEPFMQMLEQRCMPNDERETHGISRIRKVVALARSRDAREVERWNYDSERVENLRAQGLCIEFCLHLRDSL